MSFPSLSRHHKSLRCKILTNYLELEISKCSNLFLADIILFSNGNMLTKNQQQIGKQIHTQRLNIYFGIIFSPKHMFEY